MDNRVNFRNGTSFGENLRKKSGMVFFQDSSVNTIDSVNKTKQSLINTKIISKKTELNADIFHRSTISFAGNNGDKTNTLADIWSKFSQVLFTGNVDEPKLKTGKNMLSEIKAQPGIIKRLVNKYLPEDQPDVQKISLNMSDKEINNLSKIYIVASGSSRNVGNISKYIIEDLAQLPVEVDYASEFAHRKPILHKNDLVILISQSGQTKDTLAALNLAKQKGAHTLALTNKLGSDIHNGSESQMLVGAGKEKCVAATKSLTAQLVNLYSLAILLGEKRGTLTPERKNELKQELHTAGDKLEDFLKHTEKFDEIAEKLKNYNHLILLGRGTNVGVAQEGALKIKETSYIDANGYPAGEFMHGYKAVVDEEKPVISIIIPNKEDGANYKYAINNTVAVKRDGKSHLVIIKSSEDKEVESVPEFSDADFINIPPVCEEISPIFTIASLQLLALKIAEAKGVDLNNPRGITKVVTAE